jgi:alpha-1,2-mannosyltransferase
VAIALFAVCAAVSFAARLWHGYIDLMVYRNGARIWLDGGNLYGPMPKVEGLGLPFTYPPLAALFFAPLAELPRWPAEGLMLIVSIGALALTLWLVLTQLRPHLDRPTRWAVVIGAAALLGLSEPVRQTYGFGQINLLLMAAVVLDVLVPRPVWPRGMLIGITVAIKLVPAGYLLLFLLRKDWRAAITLVLSTAAAIAAGFLLMPHTSSAYWFHTLSDTGRIGPPWFSGNQSLKGFAFRLGLTHDTATAIWIVLSLITIALAALWMKQLLDIAAELPGTVRGRRALIVALLVNAAAVLLVSPISWSHHWVWVAPALLVVGDLVVRGVRGPYRRVYLGAIVALTVMFYVGPHWLVPHHHDAELRWSPWERLIGSSYVVVTFAILVIGGLGYRTVGVRNAASAAA